MTAEQLEQIEKWYENEEHQLIVNFIENLPHKEQTPELISQLGRAYNNLFYISEDENTGYNYLHKALEILLSVEPELAEDEKWNYRIGFAYFFLNDAKNARFHFEKHKALSGLDEELYAVSIIADEEGVSTREAWDLLFNRTDTEPSLYSEEEVKTLEAFIEDNFGKFNNVFHELISLDIHCDIYIIEPTEERNYYTLITGGMGAYTMEVNEDWGNVIQHAELMIYLPVDWNIHGEEESDHWPIRWLKVLARLPIEQQTFLGWGHTIPAGKKIADTNFECIMLITALDKKGAPAIVNLPNGKKVACYTLLPLYAEEAQYKLDYGAGKLLNQFSEKNIPYPPVVDLNRQNACPNYKPSSNPNALEDVAWVFNSTEFDTLMHFTEAVKNYNDEIENNLEHVNPFGTIFDSEKVKMLYEGFIKGKEDILENEKLLNEEETFLQNTTNGYYKARFIAELTTSTSLPFTALELLMSIHNTLASKELGEHIYFKGFTIEGYEEDGTPVIYLQLGS